MNSNSCAFTLDATTPAAHDRCESQKSKQHATSRVRIDRAPREFGAFDHAVAARIASRAPSTSRYRRIDEKY